MTAPCPKCGHVRNAHDTGPDYTCPQCGVVYAKYLEMLHARATKVEAITSTPTPPDALRRPVTKLEIGISVVMATLTLAYLINREQEKTAPKAIPQPSAVATVRDVTAQPRHAQAAKTPAQIEEERIDRLKTQAREVCFDTIREKALFPSSVDIHSFSGTQTARDKDGTLVKAAFTAKNANGNDLPLYAHCRISDDGRLTYYNVVPR